MEHRVPRQIIIYLAATMSDIKYIRARLSERYNRNWATVDETINTVAAEVGNNKQYKSMIDKIKLDLNGTTN